ncbi:MAG: hypothetical protein LJF30_19330 [Acidobacteria bacterium]|jgi:hypothetical protein|nr:hypothetical protein [Acidobacteriota bacterium]
MMRRLIPLAMLAVLGGCSSDDNGGSGPPTLSTPPPAISVPLNGAYDLVIDPAPSCGLADTPYVVPVNVSTFATGNGNELRATLPTGGDDLVLDMLYPEPGRLEGALSTRATVPLPAGGALHLRANGSGWVSLSADARAEVLDGPMVGDIAYYPDGVSGRLCVRDAHSWSLVAR